jgi:hypothetical protein
MKVGRVFRCVIGAAGAAGAAACSIAKSAPLVEMGAPRAISAATSVGTAPMFAVSPSGTEAVAWVSAPAGGTDGRLYIAIEGAAPIELRDPLGPIEAHGESPPKIAYGADGALNAIYVVPKVIPGRRFPLAALRFVRSTDGGKTWSQPASVTDDAVFGTHNFHALHAANDGTLYITWLDSREGDKAAVYFTRSTDNGLTWAVNHRVASSEACPCCRTSIATAADGSLYVAWRIVLPGNVRDIVVARSADRGDTFSEPVVVHADNWVYPGCPHAGPSIQVDTANHLHITWWTGKEGASGVAYARSEDQGRTFIDYEPLGIAEFSQPAHVQLALGPSGQVLVAWDDGTKHTPEVVLRVSRDGGRSFGRPRVLSTSGRAATFPVMAVAGSTVSVAWSEESAMHHHEELTADSIRKAADPNAPKGLQEVGDAQAIARSGRLL